MNLTAVTCTGDRPEAFLLCQLWMSRQTVQPSQWIVLDDGHTPVRCLMGQAHLILPYASDGSLTKKLTHLASSGLVKDGGIVFCEDDDWYSPRWLEFCARALESHEIIGEGNAIYYNVGWRQWYAHYNMAHASLCSTAIRQTALCALEWEAKDPGPFIDARIWLHERPRKVYDQGTDKLVVGIKGMPGRQGYGNGHGPDEPNAHADHSLDKLRSLIHGDAELYAPFYHL